MKRLILENVVKIMEKHYKSVFTNEQDLLKAIINIHLSGKNIQLDPMYYKGSFYKDSVYKPECRFDINPEVCRQGVTYGDARNLYMFADGSFLSMILDPLFLFGIHGKAKEYYTSRTMGIYKDFTTLENDYKLFLKEAYRLLKIGGILIFKCQDYTDSKTTMTHVKVCNWAEEQGFYAKDLAILIIPNKIYNSHLQQRHLRKIHTYFWVFVKRKK